MKSIRMFLIVLFLLGLGLVPAAWATHWTMVHQDAQIADPILNLSIVNEGNLFFAVNYVDTSTSFLGTKYWVLHSSDGGTTLTPRYFLEISPGNLIFSETTVADIFMDSMNQGHVCGMYVDGVFGMGPWVGGTLDGGTTFDKRDTFPAGVTDAYPLNVIEFIAPNKGLAAGHHNHIFKTIDGGATWSQTQNLPSKYAQGLGNYVDVWDLASDGAGGVYAVSGYSYFPYNYDGELFYSSDEGTSWTRIYTYEQLGLQDGGFGAVQFLDADYGWMTVAGTGQTAGAYTNVLYTTDGAASWLEGELPETKSSYLITDVFMNNLSRGWAVGYFLDSYNSIILVTDDGGESWNLDDYTGYGQLRRIEMIDHRTGWAVGSNLTVVSFYNIENEAPVADAGPDRSVNTEATVALDGTHSYDPDGDALTYSWELLAGNAVLDDPTLVTPTFATGAEPACYTFQLQVTDAMGQPSEPDMVTVNAGGADCDSQDDDDDDNDDDAVPDDDDDDKEEDVEEEDDEGCCG